MELHVRIVKSGPRCPFDNDTVELDVRPGECLWLKGDSGAGKSSIALHLLGLRPIPDARIHTVGSGDEPPTPSVGMVFQQGVLIDSLNVGENIGLALKKSGRSSPPEVIRERLSQVGLSESDATKMPGELSGGMLRRASLAQILAQGRSIIILDEPFVGLDETNALGIVDLIRDLMDDGHGFILISHEPHYAKRLITPGLEVYLSARGSSESVTKKHFFSHSNFFVRTAIRTFDYLVISSPLIFFAFLASGIAISMMFAELLEATSIDALRKQIIDPHPTLIKKLLGIELFQQFVGHEFDVISREHLPAIRRKIFALGVARGFIIELGPMLTGLLLAGRIGGSYAGEVAMMQATHQNQLLHTLGISPRRWTLGPSAIAALIAAPLLTAIGVGTSLWMAYTVGVSETYSLFQNSEQYWLILSEKALVYPSLWAFPPFVCFYHSIVFMVVILVVAEIAGRLRSDIQPRGVPKAITWSVVGASLVIIVADWGLSRWLQYLSPVAVL